MQQSELPMTIVLKTFCTGECPGIFFIDSTLIRVCKSKKISRNKVFSGIATKGKDYIYWFYGFKLYLVINDKRKY